MDAVAFAVKCKTHAIFRLRMLARSGSPVWHLYRLSTILKSPGLFFADKAWAKKRVGSAEGTNTLVELERSGFAPADGIVDKNLLAELLAEGDRRLAAPRSGASNMGDKNYWYQTTSETDHTADSPFVKFALQPKVLDVVTAYLGMRPVLSSVRLLESRYTDNKKWLHSQLWHRDYDDTRMVKLFVYFTDCMNPADGPVTFVDSIASKRVPNTIVPDRVSDAAMIKAVGADQIKQALQPRGACFFLDTGKCYHLGSRVERDRLRVALIISYTTRFPMSGEVPVVKAAANLY